MRFVLLVIFSLVISGESKKVKTKGASPKVEAVQNATVDELHYRNRDKQIFLVSPNDVRAYELNPKFNPKVDFRPAGVIPPPAEAGRSFHYYLKNMNGGRAEQGQFPWHATLQIDDTWLCGGSLVTADWVLTAAHCVYGAQTVKVTLGSVNHQAELKEAGKVEQDVTMIIVHYRFNNTTLENNIAMVRMENTVALNSWVNAVRMPAVRFATIKNPPVIETASSAFLRDSKSLAYSSMDLMRNSKCVGLYGIEAVPGSVLCAAHSSGDRMCAAESGAALVVQEPDGLYTQIGVASFGVSKVCSTFPVAYTRVSSYLGWISAITDMQIRK